jgi:uncharacterized protein (DUF1697 family)
MNTFVALFRGINVGGKNILPMQGLVKLLEDVGCENVKTYIQSGNAVFHMPKDNAATLARRIGQEIMKGYGFTPHILLLDKAQLEEAVKHNPFNTGVGKALHFFFLDSRPQSPDLNGLKTIKTRSEEFKLHKNVFYLYAPEGIGRSRLVAKIEKCIGVPVTARNWNTVNKLISMAGA